MQGKVFKCRSRETGNIVAIKRYHELEEENPAMKKMAYREIRSLKVTSAKMTTNILDFYFTLILMTYPVRKNRIF